MQAFLNMPMRGLPDNPQLPHSRALHQMAELLGKDYHLLVDEFRELFAAMRCPSGFATCSAQFTCNSWNLPHMGPQELTA